MGGAINYGKDGKLYIATGDNETPTNSQQLTNLFGKMLRINKDGTIPTDNPFYATASGKNRAIWALGLRNPFKFAIQPTTGTTFINDVGEDAWEEINRGAAGANYGWPRYEGPEWLCRRLLLCGPLQRVDKDARRYHWRGERVRNRAREAHRPGGEQGWRTLLPAQGQLEHSGIGEQDPVRQHSLGSAARSYKEPELLGARPYSFCPYSPKCVE